MPFNRNQDVSNVIQSTTNYNQFTLMEPNRATSRGHIEAIKKAYEERGNLTSKNPILVNENYEIIDGQHRFIASKEMGEPIYFIAQPGLNISDARAINILHRPWTIADYAESYANGGDQNYVRFLELKEDYDFSYSVLMTYAKGEQLRGTFADFRNGEFTFDDVPAARARLDKLSEASEAASNTKDQNFCYAYLKVMQVPGFDQRRMVRKLSQVSQQLIRNFGNVTEYQRALEEVYNYGITESNRLRLY